MLILFLNGVDIQLIIEFKNNFENDCLVFPKNTERVFFLGHAICIVCPTWFI